MTNREIDALVAVHVFGWQIHEPIQGKKIVVPPLDDERFNWAAIWDEYGCPHWMPKWTESIADAWQVVEKLKEMGFGVDFYSQKGFNNMVELYYDSLSTTTYDFASGDTVAAEQTAPLAICKAALKAVGVEIE